jgi:hypothetical protein
MCWLPSRLLGAGAAGIEEPDEDAEVVPLVAAQAAGLPASAAAISRTGNIACLIIENSMMNCHAADRSRGGP